MRVRRRCLRPLLRRALSKAAKNMHTVADLQRYLTLSLKALIEKTTDGFSFSGLEKLDPAKVVDSGQMLDKNEAIVGKKVLKKHVPDEYDEKLEDVDIVIRPF